MRVHFVITGDGPIRTSLEKPAGKYRKSIIFTGFLSYDDHPNIYSITDIFVMPSLCELQSISTLEALASGLPVIAAKKYVLPELVYNERNGFLFEPGDSKDLAKKIIKLLSTKLHLNRTGEESMKIACLHSLTKVIKDYKAVYESVIRNKAGIKEPYLL